MTDAPNAALAAPAAARRHGAVWSLLQAPERHPGRTIALVGALLGIAYASALVVLPKPGGRVMVGDAVHYYVYLRSAVFDRDLQFYNDYMGFIRDPGREDREGEAGLEWLEERTATGHVRNMMSVGPPIVWTPLFLTVTLGVAGARAIGVDYPLDGFGRLFQAAGSFSGIAAATIGAWLTFRLCARLYGRRMAIWSTLAMWLGSNAIYYSGISPGYSHSISMLAVSAYLLVWASTLDRQTTGRYALIGALGGLVALVRWQDAVLLIVPAIDAAMQAWETRSGRLPPSCRPPRRVPPRPAGVWSEAARHVAVSAAAAVAAFTPQIWVWMILYGQPFTMPQGSGWMQWTSPHVLAVLFSDWHGLLTWTPVVAVGLLGLIPLYWRHRRIAVALGGAFAVSLYANAAVLEWWAGEAYGARRFVSCFPIFALGFAAALDRYRERLHVLAAAAGVFIFLNVLLLLQYQAFMHGLRDVVPYPRGLYGLGVARFVAPFDLVAWLLSR